MNHEIQFFLDYIKDRSGLVFPDERLEEVNTLVEKQIATHKTNNVGGLIRAIENKVIDFNEFMNGLTIGETSFFRIQEHFDLIQNRILPELQQNHPGQDGCRFWSAACSSGEEAYSMAILLEKLSLLDKSVIIATDIADKAIAKAKKGIYTNWSFRQTDDYFKSRYFKKVKEQYQINESYRNCVDFQYLDLVGSPFPSFDKHIFDMDIIFCRNVLIYFDSVGIRVTAEKFFETLRPGGWLVTAPADPPLGDYAPFEIVPTPFGYVYRRPMTTAHQVDESNKAIELRPKRAPIQEFKPIAKEESVGKSKPQKIEVNDADLGIGKIVKIASEDFKAGKYQMVRNRLESKLETEAAAILFFKALINLPIIDTDNAILKATIKQHIISTELHFLHAIYLIKIGNNADAIVAMRQTIYLESNNAISHYFLGTLLAKDGDRPGAIRAFRNANTMCKDLDKQKELHLGDGMTAGRLAEITKDQLSALDEGGSL